MGKAKRTVVQLAHTIARFEPVTVVTRIQDRGEAKTLCGPTIDIQSWPLSDSWLRDSGPTFVHRPNGRLVALNWRFNAWGGRYSPYREDVQITERIAHYLQTEHIPVPLVLEGGAIHVDGEGTLLTTAECLLDPRRNPNHSRGDLESLLAQYLGVAKVIWLERGLTDDAARGHIDNLACFTRPGEVLIQVASDPADPDYPVTQEALACLAAATDARGRSLTITTVEQPTPRHYSDGRRLMQSYTNNYLANGAVLMPTYRDPERDAAAREVYARVFPEREVVPFPAGALIQGGWGLHGVTQQQPAGGFAMAPAA